VGRHAQSAGLHRAVALNEFDDAADVAALAHIGDGVVDLLEPVPRVTNSSSLRWPLRYIDNSIGMLARGFIPP
jgi:hypothetical protein